MSKWYLQSGPDCDIIANVRVRLARNLKDYPFPNKMSPEQKFDLIQRVSDAILKSESKYKNEFTFYDMDKLPKLEAYSMAEKHLISPGFAENGSGRALLLSRDESISIMINEEDHIRIQVLTPGLSFEKAYSIAIEIDNLLESSLEFAFDKNLGYLTECPTNLGTGMRASALMHLPALESMNALGQIAGTISKLGLTIRGTYGEGSKTKCALYQISNQVTLGISENAAIENLQGIVTQIAQRERSAREAIDPTRLKDTVYRAYGTLKYAHILSCAEFMELISKVRIGVGMGIMKEVTMEQVNELICVAQPATLQQKLGGALDPAQRDIERAKLIKEMLN